MPKAIHDAGFRPGEMHVLATGASAAGDRARFEIRGWSRAYSIEPVLPDDGSRRLDADVDFARDAPTLVHWSAHEQRAR